MGLFGAYIVFLIINWNALEHLGPARCILLVFMIFIVIMDLGAGPNSSTNIYGHLGGFLTGLFFSFAF